MDNEKKKNKKKERISISMISAGQKVQHHLTIELSLVSIIQE